MRISKLVTTDDIDVAVNLVHMSIFGRPFLEEEESEQKNTKKKNKPPVEKEKAAVPQEDEFVAPNVGKSSRNMGTRRQAAAVAPRESKKLLNEEEDLRAILAKTPEGKIVSLASKKFLFKLIAEE